MNETDCRQRLVVVGEVLWDIFDSKSLLGGAPLNFAAHVSRLGHQPFLISAVADDDLGRRARQEIAALGLDTTFVETTTLFPTGTASVGLGPDGEPRFVIHRPAAYDALRLSQATIDRLIQWIPDWLYYGTLFPSESAGKEILFGLIAAFPGMKLLYDVNLRRNFDSPLLVRELIALASVVKLNEVEVLAVADNVGLPTEHEAFCRAGRDRYGWQAACVTLGPRGCAILVGDEYIEAGGYAVHVEDSVGAGDAFTAAFVHGLSQCWRPTDIGQFANRIGALVASRSGAIPEWSVEEASALN